MKSRFMATAAIVAILAATGAARADEISDIKAQSIALKKQNAALEARLNRLEKLQAKQEKKIDAKVAAAPAPQPAQESFLGMVTKGPLEAINDDGPICWKGVCIFGTLDAGLGWESHGAPGNSLHYAGDTVMAKMNNHSYFGILPSGLSQTGLGIKAAHEIISGWSGVFYASTGINPQSGQLANAPGSVASQNGVALGSQTWNGDGSRGGQAFNDQIYVGVSSKDFGQLTVGRHKSLSNDMIGNYDPAGGSYNYSVIGLSGTPVAGLGYTDLGRIDDTLKYRVVYGPMHFAALYKFADGTAGTTSSYATATTAASGACAASTIAGGTNYCTNTTAVGLKSKNDGFQFDLGGQYAGFEMDGVVSHFNQAITYGGFGLGTLTTNGNQVSTLGLNGLIATPADITSVMLNGKYTWDQFKFYASYAHDNLQNPHNLLGVGANTGQGDYTSLLVNDNGFNGKTKILQTEWAGVKYAYDAKTEFTVAYYHESQNNYDTNANIKAGKCSLAVKHNNSALDSSCSGALNGVSTYVDYHFNKHFDVYGGMMLTTVAGGMASGFLQSNEIVPSAGARYAF